MADGDHGQLYLRGEHNVGHGIGEELISSLVQLIDNDRETENLRHQNVSKISRFTECPELNTFNKDVKKKVGEGATNFIRNISNLQIKKYSMTHLNKK